MPEKDKVSKEEIYSSKQRADDIRTSFANELTDIIREKGNEWPTSWTEINTLFNNYNAATGSAYTGINQLYLTLIAKQRGYDDPRWCTYNQARQNGWQVSNAKGMGVQVERYKVYNKNSGQVIDWPDYFKLSSNEKKEYRFYPVYDYVFNAKHILNIPEYYKAVQPVVDISNEEKIKHIANVMGVEIKESINEKTYYSKQEDIIYIPNSDTFKDKDTYNSIVLAELLYASGHGARLNRDPKETYGVLDAAFEKLSIDIALCEMGIRFEPGLIQHMSEHHDDYSERWLMSLQQKPERLIKVMKEAEKITNFIKLQVNAEIEQNQVKENYVSVPAASVDEGKVIPEPSVDKFEIYQVKNGKEYDKYRFSDMYLINAWNLEINPNNYEMVYGDELKQEDTLESLFERFNNGNYPEQYRGHSMSVSDIVVMHRNGIDEAFFCDDLGFKDVTKEFLEYEKVEPKVKETIEKTVQKSNESKSNAHKIDDFGEKIGGARKELWMGRGLQLADLADWNDKEYTAFIKKDNVWIKPDYEGMVKSGVPVEVAYFVKQVRDATPTKPRSNTRVEQENYVQFVSQLRDEVQKCKTIEDCKNFFSYWERNGYVVRRSAQPKAYGLLNKKLYTASQVNLYKIQRKISEKHFCMSEKEKAFNDFQVHLLDGVSWQFDKQENAMKYSTMHEKAWYYSPKTLDLAEWQLGTYFIISGHQLIAGNLSKESAEELVMTLYSKKQEIKTSKQKARKKNFTPKQLENIQRIGIQTHIGNVGTDQIQMDFGFRGGEFGNWMNNVDRQASLNYSYDALFDLAYVLKIPTQQISLGGELAIAYGSRGVANAVAHYEPMRQVFNLTKMKGAGSLAHEWGHALDDSIGRYFGITGNNFASDCPNRESIKKILPSFTELMNKMTDRNSDYYKNSKEFDSHYSKSDKGYWSSNKEMFARAFSCYVTDKLKENGQRSDYLSGHSESAITRVTGENGESKVIVAIPQGDERKELNRLFDETFEELKLREIVFTRTNELNEDKRMNIDSTRVSIKDKMKAMKTVADERNSSLNSAHEQDKENKHEK